MSDIEKQSSAGTEVVRPPRPSRLGNPAPMGMYAFGSSTFILSLYNAGARHITHVNAVVGMAFWCGGISQILAGMWMVPRGDTFGATVFTSYGCFWLSYASLFIPGFGILQAYADPSELGAALGIYLLTWLIVTFAFNVVAMGKYWSFVTLFTVLTTTLGVLAAGSFAGSETLTKAGGVLGVIVAFLAWYIAFALHLDGEEDPIFRLPLFPVKRSPKHKST